MAAFLYATALVIFWVGVLCFAVRASGLSWVTLRTYCPVRGGAYGYIRHPFCTSYILGWLAAVIAVLTLLIALILVVLTTIYARAAIREELGFSESSFASDYVEYRRRTGCFFRW